MRRKILTYLCYLPMLFACVSVFAQKTPPSPEPKPNGPINPGLPIDGGVSLLVIIGAAYGVYALKKK